MSKLEHPDYYGGDGTYEVLKVIEALEMDFHLGNVFKYIARAGKKDPAKEIEDLKKAQVYLRRKIEYLERHLPPASEERKNYILNPEIHGEPNT